VRNKLLRLSLFTSSLRYKSSTIRYSANSLKKMSTPSDQLSLPLSLFSSSSNFESRPRPVHASDCSLRPQRNIIRIKEEWWGPQEVVDAGETGSVEEAMQGQRERDSKRRKTTSNGLDEIARSSRLHEIDLRQSGSLALSTSPAIVNLSSNSPESSRRRPPSTPSQQDTRDTPAPCAGETGANPSVISPRSLGPSLRENPSPAPQNPCLPLSAPRHRLRSATGFLEIPLGDLLHLLEFADFEPFITKRPVEPTHSLAFHRIQIEYFTSASNPAKWSTRYGSKIFNRPYFPPLTDKVMNLQPNFEYIRQHYPLRLSLSSLDIPKKEKQRWEDLARVLDWIYGMKVKIRELVFFVETVPRPLLALRESLTSA